MTSPREAAGAGPLRGRPAPCRPSSGFGSAVLTVEAGPPTAVPVAAQALHDERVVGGHARLVEYVVQQLVVAGVGQPEAVADGLGLRAGEGTPGPLEIDDVAAPLRELHQVSDPQLKVSPGQRPPSVATAPGTESHRQRWH